MAQRGVYEFHQNIELLSQSDGTTKVSEILNLKQEAIEVREKVELILNNYYDKPILLEKDILELKRGDESYPEPIPIKYGNLTFALYASFDCVLLEPENIIHILDLKTGKSEFDIRQGYVYLVAAQNLYPQQKVIASFYNLETQVQSEPINLSSTAIDSVCIELLLVAQKLHKDRQRYNKNPALFDRIFPPNPGSRCKYCNFNSICEYATS